MGGIMAVGPLLIGLERLYMKCVRRGGPSCEACGVNVLEIGRSRQGCRSHLRRRPHHRQTERHFLFSPLLVFSVLSWQISRWKDVEVEACVTEEIHRLLELGKNIPACFAA
jgi:hypothetical protein